MTSLEKGLYLLSLFADEPYKWTVIQLVERTGMNRTTVYRILETLEKQGMLVKESNGKAYKMGPVPYHMGNVYLMNANYRESILSILEKIALESSESVGIAHREGNQVLSIYSVEIHQPVKINDKPGTFYPMNKGCYGKCLMAYHDPDIVESLLENATFEKTTPKTLTEKAEILMEYENIRRQGFVESNLETSPYILGVGIPLRSAGGSVENVVAISFFKQEDSMEKMERMKAILLKYQKELEPYFA
jgi:DNA-binding IclR family transcriptional regulator